MSALESEPVFRSYLAKLIPYVDSLAQIDEDGQELRYHKNRDGKQSLDDQSLANIEVIRSSLKELSKFLEKLKNRTFSLCEEKHTNAFTSCCSRVDLFEIAKCLPNQEEWSDPKFDVIKNSIKKRYNISGRKFSEALTVIQSNREMSNLIGVENELIYLSGESAAFVVEQWQKIHPHIEQRDNLGTDYFNLGRFDKMAADRKIEISVLDAIEGRLSVQEIADAQTIYYLARNNEYSELYENKLDSTIREYEASDEIRQKIHHLIQKTNLLEMLSLGVEKLGNVNLSNELRRLRS